MKDYTQEVNELRARFKAGDDIRDAGLTTPENVVRFDDLAYGPDPMQVLDIYCPKNSAGANPTILDVHGGGYVYGDKERYQYYCMDLARRGFTVINFSYPLAPEHCFPEHLINTNLAAAYAVAHASKYHVDPNNMFLAGDSAGAQIASQYAAACSNPAYAAELGLDIPDMTVRACALNCGLYQNLTEKPDSAMAWYLGDPADWTPEVIRLMDVCSYITKDYPAAFIMSGKGDFLLGNAEPFYRFLQEKGVEAELHLYGMDGIEDLGHVFHCNIRSHAAIICNNDECSFFLKHRAGAFAAPVKPAEEPKPSREELKAVTAPQKKWFSRLGFRYLWFSLLFLLIEGGMGVVCSLFLPAEAYNTWYMLLVMAPVYLLVFPFSAWFISRIPKTGPLQQPKPFTVWNLLLSIPICFGLVYVGNAVGTMLSNICSAFTGVESTDAVSELLSDMELWQSILIVGIVGPVMEELLFRKVLIDRLLRFGEGAAIVISALAFGFFHGNITQFCYAFLVGLALGYVYCKSGKIHFTMLLHILVNLLCGVLSSAILSLINYDELMAAAETLNEFELEIFVSANMSRYIALYCYFGIMLLLYISGLVLFVIFVLNSGTRKVHLVNGPEKLVKGRRFSTVVLNAGVLLFIAFWLIMMFVSLYV